MDAHKVTVQAVELGRQLERHGALDGVDERCLEMLVESGEPPHEVVHRAMDMWPQAFSKADRAAYQRRG